MARSPDIDTIPTMIAVMRVPTRCLELRIAMKNIQNRATGSSHVLTPIAKKRTQTVSAPSHPTQFFAVGAVV
jgi:hypothetical protein